VFVKIAMQSRIPPPPLDAYLPFKAPKVFKEGRSKIKITHT